MDHDSDFATGARMIAAALASAVVTATFVIAVGQSMIDRSAPQADREAVVVRTSG